MSKKDLHKRDLSQLLDEFLISCDDDMIIKYLTSNSNLPGRRANLELAEAFAEVAEDYSKEYKEKIWELCIKFSEFSQDEAPINDPLEFLPFCGAYAIGAVGSVHPGLFEESLSRLRRIADDPRWRIREAVAFGIQKLLEKDSERTLKELEGWI